MATEFILLNNEELKTLHQHPDFTQSVVIVDVRNPMEYAQEHIAGSQNVPLSEIATTDFSDKKDKIAIFHCQLGRRTLAAKEAILKTGFQKIYCLEGGLKQWKDCGFPVIVDRSAPMDVMRQVQIVAGILILLGVLLGFSISSYFFFPIFSFIFVCLFESL